MDPVVAAADDTLWILWLLRGIEKFFRKCGKWIGKLYYKPVVLMIQASLGYACAIFCAIKVEHWTGLMIGAVGFIGGVGLVGFLNLIKETYAKVRILLNHFGNQFVALPLIVMIIGSIGVLKGFVLLSNEIEKNKQLGFYAIGFFLSCHLSLVSVMKLF